MYSRLDPSRKRPPTNEELIENLSKRVSELESELRLEKRRNLVKYFISSIYYKSMDVETLTVELNRFIDGALKL